MGGGGQGRRFDCGVRLGGGEVVIVAWCAWDFDVLLLGSERDVCAMD